MKANVTTWQEYTHQEEEYPKVTTVNYKDKKKEEKMKNAIEYLKTAEGQTKRDFLATKAKPMNLRYQGNIKYRE